MSDDTSKRVAERFLKQAMAYPRAEFKNKVQGHLIGAIIEFYKATLATKNGQTKWVKHWLSEVKQLVETKLVAEILHPVRGFKDRRKAFDEAVAEIKTRDASFRRYAEHTVKRDYKLTKTKVGLGDDDTAAFWARVEGVAEAAIDAAAEAPLRRSARSRK